MKNIKNFKALFFVLFAGFILPSCKNNFLDRKPLDRLVDATYYKTADELLMGTASLYNVVWFEFNSNNYLNVGSARGGELFSPYGYQSHTRFSSSSTDAELIPAWSSLYNVIAQSNAVIRNVNLYAAPSIPESNKRQAIAEARFMRGAAYSFLVHNWNEVPVIEDNIKLLNDTALTRNTIETVWEFIIRDFTYASQNLPPVPVQPGRLTKWSAEGMLAKAYLNRSGIGKTAASRSQSDLDSAKYYSGDVVHNSGLALLPNYEDLFKYAFDNNQESLFALQWVYNGSYGTANVIQGNMAFSSSITGFADGWGGENMASADILKAYEPADTIRRKATYMFPGDHYSYIHQLVPDPNDPTKRIPIELVATKVNGANIKKGVVGLPMDNDGQTAQQATPNNTYIMRLAEVYLIYAEAVLGNAPSTADAEALKYFNLVRARAKIAPKTSITFDDIFHEKRIECAMEGNTWGEIVRLYYFNPNKALDMLNKMDKGNYTIELVPNTNPHQWNITYSPTFYPVDASHLFLPYPEVELTKAPNLRKPAVPYEFTN